MARDQTVNVSAIIDGGRFGALQWSIAIWCALLVTLDGFDNSAINFAAPTIIKEWNVPAPSFGPVFGAGLFGLMLGALASGPIADRFGRKIVILASTLVFAMFALATTLAIRSTALCAPLPHRHRRRRAHAEFDCVDRGICAEAVSARRPSPSCSWDFPLGAGGGRLHRRAADSASAGNPCSFSAACCR